MQYKDKMNFFAAFLLLFSLVTQLAAEDDYCKGKVDKFTVKGAFKIRDWLIVFGDLVRKGAPKATHEVVRINFNEKGDPTEDIKSTEFYYFEAKLWPEMRAETVDPSTDAFNMTYGFSTIGLNIFYRQIDGYVAYIANNKGITKAYDINTRRPLSADGKLTHPSFAIDQNRLVYDANAGEDHSRKLTLKVLILHFPKIVTVLDVMIFKRPLDNGNQQYHALVYTEEQKDGKYHYMRHLMKSESKYYEDYAYRKFERLYWSFDDANDYCDKMDAKITALAYLREEEIKGKMYNPVDYYPDSFAIYFVEFYGEKHRLMKLQFLHRIEYFKITTEVEAIDNVELLNCVAHPDTLPAAKIRCDDYPLEPVDDIGSYDSPDDNLVMVEASRDGTEPKGTTIWQWLGMIMLLMAIIVVIVLIVYMLVSTQNTKPNSDKQK